MYNLVKKNNSKILVSLISVMVLFLGLTFLVRKENKSLTEHQKRLKLYDQVQTGDDLISGTNYVTFDAYFLEDTDGDGRAEGIRGNSIEIDDSRKLYLEVKVLGNGILENANISFINSNVSLSGNITKSSVVKKTVNSTNIVSIPLNESIGNGTTAVIPVSVNANLTNDLNSFSATNKVKLTGTVRDNITGETTEIEKIVDYTADFYATKINANIASNYTTNYVSVTEDSTNNAKIIYDFQTYSNTHTLLKNAYIEATVPKLNGFDPVNVKVEGVNVTYTYDPLTLTLNAKRESVLNDTLITTQAYTYKTTAGLTNDWKVIVEYPAAASIDNAVPALSVRAYYEGYNNSKPGYTNPIVSDVASKALVAKYVPDYKDDDNATVFITSIDLGNYSSALSKNYINKTSAIKLYDGDVADTKTEYKETLHVKMLSQNENEQAKSIVINLQDQTFNYSPSITNLTKYKSIKFTSAERYLGSSGYIKLYNAETDELVHIFTALDWNTPYTFDTPVRKIRLETSELSKDTYRDWKRINSYTPANTDIPIFDVESVKEINNELIVSTYTRDGFDTFDYVRGSTKTNTTIYNAKNDRTYTFSENTTQYGTADYITYMSSTLTGSITNTSYETITSVDSNKDKEVVINLTTGDFYDIVQGWINGEFIVVLPTEILDIDIEEITTGNNNVTIEGYEKVEIDGHKCIRILTSNTNEEKYNIHIKGVITPDARTSSKSTTIALYGYNGSTGLSSRSAQDIYDVNGNLDTDERVNYGTISLRIEAPNEIITTATYVDRDSKRTVSPLIAEVNPINDSNVGTVEIGVTNSSQYSVENIVIIGKIGFIGNTYQITADNSQMDLGSEFDSKMVSTGITYPDTINGVSTMLDGKVTIYYSDKETPTKDVNNASNNWKTKDQVADFATIKTYMIVINDYVLDPGKQTRFTYDVELPLNTSNLNKVTYFNHGVYYDAILEEGTHALVTGGAKLGIRVSRQYNLELTDSKVESTRKINGSKYLITTKDGNNIVDQRILTTNQNGLATTKGLYVGREYELKQISVKEPYIIDEETKTFKVINNASDNLEIVSNGTIKNISLANDQKLNIDLENETKYNLVLNNTDIATDAIIPYGQYKITGKGYESGYIVLADENGQLKLNGLYLDEEYEVEQVKVNNYLLTSNFKFEIARDADGDVKIVTGAALPTVSNATSLQNFNASTPGHYNVTDTSSYAIVGVPISIPESDKEYIVGYDMVNEPLATVYVIEGDCTSLLATNAGYSYTVSGQGGTSSPAFVNADYIPANSSGSYTTNKVVTVSGGTPSINYTNLKGNKDYCFVALKTMVAGNIDVSNIHVLVADGSTLSSMTTTPDYPTKENANALLTINDSDNQDAPVLTVKVKNDAIPKYTLVLTKENAETHEVLAGAQYKVTGPGLPSTGKYLTTDANGKATIELYKKYDIYNTNGTANQTYNGVDYNQYNSEYTIEEVTAPVGYTLDDKPVTFAGVLNLYTVYNNANLTDNEITRKVHVVEYASSNKFKAATWDETNNTLNVTMYDYPVIRITKKDAETGDILPNTLFTIYNVQIVNGTEILTPAINSKGNIVGDLINIDGHDYYVVVTDSNGQINLDLSAGRYKLKEVQAASDKYELSGATYYFGVGETVPYQTGSVELTSSYEPDHFISSEYSKIYPTKDGGWIINDRDKNDYSKTYLTKLDKDLNVEWKVDSKINYAGTAYYTSYFDDPTRREIAMGAVNVSNTSEDIIELDDGGFALVSYSYGIVTKFDKDGNRVWNNFGSYYYGSITYDRVCTYDGNANSEGHVPIYIDQYNSSTGQYEQVFQRQYLGYNSSTGQYEYGDIIYYDLDDGSANVYYGPTARRDADTYYCHATSNSKYYNTFYNNRAWIHELQDGSIIEFLSNSNTSSLTDSNPNYSIVLDDGTTFASYAKNPILRFDKDGKFVGYYDLYEIFKTAESKYMTKYGLTTSPFPSSSSSLNNNTYEYKSIYSYPNGDILVLFEYYNNGGHKVALKLHFNEATKQFEDVYFAPIGVDGHKIDYTHRSADHTTDNLRITDDGGFLYTTTANNICISTDPNNTWSSARIEDYYNTAQQQYGIDFSNYSTFSEFCGDAMVAYDGTGTIKDFIPVTTSDGHDPYNITVLGYDTLGIFSGYFKRSFAIEVSNGNYIIGFAGKGIKNNNSMDRMVKLVSGEIVTIDADTSYIIASVSSEGVNWVKQYKGLQPFYSSDSSLTYAIGARLSNDGKTIAMPANINANDHIEEIGNPNIPLIENTTSSLKGLIVFFDVQNEVTSSGPEAYTLNIENKRKEYKITGKSNEGGQITVTNPDNGQNVVVSDGSSTTVLEKVKYGDDNKYTIKIKPNRGYVVSTVEVNGEDASFTVNNDGTVTLSTIENITENKEINITYVQGEAQVIVKHYLNGTTTSVFSDDILTGVDGTSYKADFKTSYLYSLVKENDEPVLPNNMEGTFDIDNIQTVIFYYVENEVDLKVNYYVEGTEIELAPTKTERKTLGSRYQTSPLDIEFYNLSRTIGDESGTLTSATTVVSYMYSQNTEAKITIRYVDKATNQDIITPVTKTVPIHDPYTTDDPVTIPGKYRLASVTGVPSGTAEDAEIEVIYYYEEIPFNVSVDKKINSVLLNGEKQTITDGKNVTIKPQKKDSLIVYYEINLKNTGDIKADFKVVEGEVPGFEIYDMGNFVKTTAGYELTASLDPGEEKTYRIGYKWNQKDYGISTNKVELKEVKNDKGFDEPDSSDNISTATVETEIPNVLGELITTVPNTMDNLKTFIILFVTSITGMIISLVIIRKRRFN